MSSDPESPAGGAPEVRAAGGVVWRRRRTAHAHRPVTDRPHGDARDPEGSAADPDDGIEVLLVHRPRYDDWSFPKGKLDDGERDEDAARREVEEETGVRAALGVELPSVRYADHRGRDKVVRYWAMMPVGELPWSPGDEVDDVRWVPLADAAAHLSYHHDREVLAALVEALDDPA